MWQEVKDREFWLSSKPNNVVMREKALKEMTASNLTPTDFTSSMNGWIESMMNIHPNLILVSDTSNFDFAAWDHYLRTYLGKDTINWATRNGYVMPVDCTSFYAGLCQQPFNFSAWDNFTAVNCIEAAGFTLPDVSHVINTCSHDPLDDAMVIAIRFAAVVYQLTHASQKKK